MSSTDSVFDEFGAHDSYPFICIALTSGTTDLSGAVLACIQKNLSEIDAMSGSSCMLVTLRNNFGVILPSRRPPRRTRTVKSLEAIRGYATLDSDVYGLCTQLQVPYESLPAFLFTENVNGKVACFAAETLMARFDEEPDDDVVMRMFRGLFTDVGEAAKKRRGERLKELQQKVKRRTGSGGSLLASGLISEMIRGLVGAALDQTK